MEIRPRDTSPEAWEAYWAVIAAMKPEDKAKLFLDACETARELARTGIRIRHPEYGNHEVGMALIRLMYGDDLFRKAFPAANVAL